MKTLILVVIAAILTTFSSAYAAETAATACAKVANQETCDVIANIELCIKEERIDRKLLGKFAGVKKEISRLRASDKLRGDQIAELQARVSKLEQVVQMNLCNTGDPELLKLCKQVELKALNHDDFFAQVEAVTTGRSAQALVIDETLDPSSGKVLRRKQTFSPEHGSVNRANYAFEGVHITEAPSGARAVSVIDVRPSPNFGGPTQQYLELQRKLEENSSSQRGGFWTGCLAGAAIMGGAGVGIGYGIGSSEEVDGVVVSSNKGEMMAISGSVGAVVGCVSGGLVQHFAF